MIKPFYEQSSIKQLQSKQIYDFLNSISLGQLVRERAEKEAGEKTVEFMAQEQVDDVTVGNSDVGKSAAAM